MLRRKFRQVGAEVRHGHVGQIANSRAQSARDSRTVQIVDLERTVLRLTTEMRRQTELLKADEDADRGCGTTRTDQHVRRDRARRRYQVQVTSTFTDQRAHERHRLRIEYPNRQGRLWLRPGSRLRPRYRRKRSCSLSWDFSSPVGLIGGNPPRDQGNLRRRSPRRSTCLRSNSSS